MAWNWSRKQTATPAANRGCLGIDLDASRARAATGSSTRNRTHLLDDPHPDLPLAVSLEKRSLEIGRSGDNLRRRLPHLACFGYLPLLGQPHEWKGGRHQIDAGAALSLAFDRLRASTGHFDHLYLGLPAYLSLPQIAKLTAIAAASRFPLNGTACSALALAADRANALVNNLPTEVGAAEDGIVRLHPAGVAPLPVDALVVDADDHAITGSLIRIEADHVRLLGLTVLARLSARIWKDRLLDSISDRCVRVCRRDPRDSAEAEQLLFDQIDGCLDRIRAGQRVVLTVRSAHWYQDLELQPDDIELSCASMTRQAVDGIRDLVQSGLSPEPPRAIWLTYEAGRLPGLARSLHQHMSECTSVGVLRPEAVAAAVANLGERWSAGELPNTHLDSRIPIQLLVSDSKQPTIPAVKSHG